MARKPQSKKRKARRTKRNMYNGVIKEVWHGVKLIAASIVFLTIVFLVSQAKADSLPANTNSTGNDATQYAKQITHVQQQKGPLLIPPLPSPWESDSPDSIDDTMRGVPLGNQPLQNPNQIGPILDYTPAALFKLQDQLLAPLANPLPGFPKITPLHMNQQMNQKLFLKAQYFEDEIWRFHVSPDHQVHPQVLLPQTAGTLPVYMHGADNSTWNGALLAALSLKYAVTKDPVTRERIIELLHGMHFFHTITTYPGLIARCIVKSDVPVAGCKRKYISPDGEVYHYRTEPAKGTYNQIIAGYAACEMFVAHDLPPTVQAMMRDDLGAFIWHVIKHDYQLVEASRAKTPYGNLTPLIGSKSVPFNAQVAYMIVATGRHFPPPNPHVKQLILKQFKRLRIEHHVYYESPARHLIVPQTIGASPLVKGMNDRNHVNTAAFWGLMLELNHSATTSTPVDKEFFYQLGQTMYHTMHKIERDKNALANFMWLGMLKDPRRAQILIPVQELNLIERQKRILYQDAIEQLHRFTLDRFTYVGHRVDVDYPTWVDQRIAKDCFYWKSDPKEAWVTTGERSHAHTCSIDYLYAYWLMRYFRLDKSL